MSITSARMIVNDGGSTQESTYYANESAYKRKNYTDAQRNRGNYENFDEPIKESYAQWMRGNSLFGLDYDYEKSAVNAWLNGSSVADALNYANTRKWEHFKNDALLQLSKLQNLGKQSMQSGEGQQLLEQLLAALGINTEDSSSGDTSGNTSDTGGGDGGRGGNGYNTTSASSIGKFEVNGNEYGYDPASMIQMISDMTKANNEWSAEQAKKQMDFQERMARNAHVYEIEDLKNAGLNPVLSAGGSGAAVPVGASATSQNDASAIAQIALYALETVQEVSASGASNKKNDLLSKIMDSTVGQSFIRGIGRSLASRLVSKIF